MRWIIRFTKKLSWEKLDVWNQEHYFSEHPNYGSLMPMGGPFLNRGQLDFIEQWIYAGAPDSVLLLILFC